MSAPTVGALAAERARDTTGHGLRCVAGVHADPSWPPPGPVSCTCPCHHGAAS